MVRKRKGFFQKYIIFASVLDIKLVLVSGLTCMISLFVGWGIRGTNLMPIKDELFLTDVLMCVVASVAVIATYD